MERLMGLAELIRHFFRLYGLRNALRFRGLSDRINFLLLAVGDLQDAIRKEASHDDLSTAIARVVSRIFCVADHFGEWLPLAKTFAGKYLGTGCAYCHHNPCQCPEHRPDAVLDDDIATTRANWNLAKCCRHLARLYGERNRERGLENLLNRLFREVCEIQRLVFLLPTAGEDSDNLLIEVAGELADVLAWTVAIANFLSIDLETAVLERYGNGCWHCHHTPCSCGPFNTDQVVWAQH